jgi:hypothetical protein
MDRPLRHPPGRDEEETEVLARIHGLMARCRVLEKQHHGVGLSADQRKLLSALRSQVDGEWESLRRHRAARRRSAATAVADLVRPPAPSFGGRWKRAAATLPEHLVAPTPGGHGTGGAGVPTGPPPSRA